MTKKATVESLELTTLAISKRAVAGNGKPSSHEVRIVFNVLHHISY